MFDRLEFLFGEATMALRRNVLMALAAITTVAVSLFLIGGLGYVYFRIDEYARTLPGKQEMRVFLRSGAPYAQITETAKQIRAMPGVASAVWMPKEKVWEKERLQHPDLTEGIENPYPDAFKVTLSDLSSAGKVAGAIRAMPAVEPAGGVVYLEKELEFIDQAMRVVRWLGSVFGSLLFVTGGVLIYNAIRLTILSRRVEVRIMQLVGATRLTIRAPFVIEGIVQGALGGALAALMVLASHQVFARFIESLKADVTSPPFPLGLALAGLSLAGATYGLLCSVVAVRSPMRLQ